MSIGLLIAKGKTLHERLPRLANRLGLIAGATGTGKTMTLRVLAEHFSAIGVPVFMADVKGDLSGIARPGSDNPKIAERLALIGVEDFRFTVLQAYVWIVCHVQLILFTTHKRLGFEISSRQGAKAPSSEEKYTYSYG